MGLLLIIGRIFLTIIVVFNNTIKNKLVSSYLTLYTTTMIPMRTRQSINDWLNTCTLNEQEMNSPRINAEICCICCNNFSFIPEEALALGYMTPPPIIQFTICRSGQYHSCGFRGHNVHRACMKTFLKSLCKTRSEKHVQQQSAMSNNNIEDVKTHDGTDNGGANDILTTAVAKELLPFSLTSSTSIPVSLPKFKHMSHEVEVFCPLCTKRTGVFVHDDDPIVADDSSPSIITTSTPTVASSPPTTPRKHMLSTVRSSLSSAPIVTIAPPTQQSPRMIMNADVHLQRLHDLFRNWHQQIHDDCDLSKK